MLKLLLRKFKSKDGIQFPLEKQTNGFYPNLLTTGGHLRCPNCDNVHWVVYKYTQIECNLCHKMYNNYGDVGLEDITPPSHYIFLN